MCECLYILLNLLGSLLCESSLIIHHHIVHFVPSLTIISQKQDVSQLWQKISLPIHPPLPRRHLPPNTQTQRSHHPHATSSRLHCRTDVSISSQYPKGGFERVTPICQWDGLL